MLIPLKNPRARKNKHFKTPPKVRGHFGKVAYTQSWNDFVLTDFGAFP